MKNVIAAACVLIVVFGLFAWTIYSVPYMIKEEEHRQNEVLTKLYQEGTKASAVGVPHEACPYITKINREAWLRGWVDNYGNKEKLP